MFEFILSLILLIICVFGVINVFLLISGDVEFNL